MSSTDHNDLNSTELAVLKVLWADGRRSAREVHDEIIASDDQLRMYVRMLEAEFDRRAEAQIPSADDLGDQFEQFLKDQRED